ncbi:MAG TPA: aminoglycoside phosphotransferase, partial [Gammaproteobacteria bacterium]
ARLNHRDGKPSYLRDIPRTMSYVEEVAGRYAELGQLHDYIVREVKPAMIRAGMDLAS